jgi:oxygen-independent coproporphyrinogen-3 oxidase
LALEDELVLALIQEFLQRKRAWKNGIETLYFGGGTPSILKNSNLELIVDTLKQNLDFSEIQEITLECNPEDISPEKLKFWKKLGFTRLSMGVQSFFDEELKNMGRNHQANQSIKALEDIVQSDFKENFSIDLIYGNPINDTFWKKNLEIVKKFHPPHLSCYALTVEPDTKLAYRISKGKNLPIKDQKAVQDFEYLRKWAQENTYDHYELSNFAKQGKRSQHNQAYWQGKNYIGIGPGAHSFSGNERRWNISNNPKYIQSIRQKTCFWEVEKLSTKDRFNEWLMVSLRRASGIHKEELLNFPLDFQKEFWENMKFQKMYFIESPKNLQLKPEHWMISDGIIAEFFIV